MNKGVRAPAPIPWPDGVTHPEHCGVDDERELEPEVGEARAVAHLLRIPAGHPGLPGRVPCCEQPHLRLPAGFPAPPPGARSGTDTREPQSQPGPATSQFQRPMSERLRPSLWEGAGRGRGCGPGPGGGEGRVAGEGFAKEVACNFGKAFAKERRGSL